MAESQGFSHITVTPDDDDDVVIWAGAASEEAAVDAADAAGDGAADDVATDDVAADDVAADDAPEAADDLPDADEPEAAGDLPEAELEPVEPYAAEEAEVADALGVVDDVAEAVAGSPKAASADDYHETTLDDLASSKMSTTQKAVILVALAGIIAFVVWYVLAR